MEHTWWIGGAAAAARPSLPHEAPSARQRSYWNRTMRHAGPVFNEPYQAHGVPIIYRGSKLVLPAEAEEAATLYAATQGVHVPTDSKTFTRNFFNDFRALLPAELRDVIVRFEDIDFSLIKAHHDEKMARRREMRKERREARVDGRSQFGTAMVDGTPNTIANYMIEPPGIFRGRGAHPLAGRLKSRVVPEDVELNLDAEAPIPVPHFITEDGQVVPMPGRQWKRIHSNPAVAWIGCWQDKLTDSMKYVFLSASSLLSRNMESKMWDRVKQVSKEMERVRQFYQENLSNSESIKNRQLATVLFLIDRYSLRLGSEKKLLDSINPEFASVLTLRRRHVSVIQAGNSTPVTVIFDFVEDAIIPLHLEKEDVTAILSPDLSPKTMRQFNFSTALERFLLAEEANLSQLHLVEKIALFNRCNAKAAQSCHIGSSTTSPPRIDLLETQLKQLIETIERSKEDDSNLPGMRLKAQQIAERIVRLREEGAFSVPRVVLTTSKVNLSDPRITLSWCIRSGVPVDKIYSKPLQERHAWAASLPPAELAAFRFIDAPK